MLEEKVDSVLIELVWGVFIKAQCVDLGAHGLVPFFTFLFLFIVVDVISKSKCVTS